MNKKLLPLAVAATITAPAVGLADATLYGRAHVSIDSFDIKGEDAYKGWALNKGKIGKGNDRANYLGVRGSEDVGADLKVIYQVEFGIPLANETDYHITDGDQGGVKMRNSYVGLKSRLGTLFAGRHDTPLKISTSKLEMFDNTMADYENAVGFDDNRADSTIAYISPNFWGLQFAAATLPSAASTENGQKNREADGLAGGYSLAATYENGPWYASAAYEVLKEDLSHSMAEVNKAQEDFDQGLIDVNERDEVIAEHGSTSDFKKWRIGLGIRDLNGFYLSTIYEKQTSINFHEKIANKDNNATVWQGQAGYAFGQNMIKAMYGKKSFDVSTESDTKSWAVGIDHNFSKRTKAYVLYTKVDTERDYDEGDWTGLSLGMIHSF